ncbi:hypothetical protein [Chryseobacterium arthrosphaerae]|uniref:hypothetical protein n=1 Tax=Chryseobacterium arthrosphaerae TaxID=651561 RepID=UPI001E48A632|nr:hypothetical protein [Chryseobacterium arthrosphaerae]UEQ76491.1 hypothetical protein J8N07_23270 [Chryseobacterium arthrosphaerae]
MKRILPVCFLLLLANGKDSAKAHERNHSQIIPCVQSSTDTDFISYPVDDLEGITSTGYNGIYRNFDFNYRNGETIFILVPKAGAEKWYRQKVKQYKKETDARIEKYLNGQSFRSLSKEFDILIFHTPKKFLKHTPEMDAPYIPLPQRKIFLYQYNSTNNTWKTIDTFTVNRDDDEAKASQWRENHMVKLSSVQ